MTEPTIISTPDTCGGEPRIAGRRITVWDIAAWLTIDDPAFDKSDAAIASAYHDLRAEEVAAARLWLREHPAELATYRERQALYERVNDDPDWAVDEIRRLRAREVALVAALSEYAKSENWGEFWNTDDDGHTTGVIGATGVWAGPGDEPYDVAREALAADLSAPATTEERS
jgi:uncharacterized protein (DUF433 family)